MSELERGRYKPTLLHLKPDDIITPLSAVVDFCHHETYYISHSTSSLFGFNATFIFLQMQVPSLVLAHFRNLFKIKLSYRKCILILAGFKLRTLSIRRLLTTKESMNPRK